MGGSMITPDSPSKWLTFGGPGAVSRAPDKCCPTTLRNYFRLMPNDAVQAAAIATAMRDRGCTKIAVRRDRTPYGRGLAADFRTSAARLGLKIVSLRKANCMIFAGLTANGAVRIFKSAPKKILLFGGDGVGEQSFVEHLPRSVARRTFVTVDTLAPENYGLSGRTDPYQAFG